ncbi:MAG: undecaprenyl-phosphate glucose phosphotransferase [Pseudomonadota bacterium]
MPLKRGILRAHAELLEFGIRMADVAMVALSGLIALWLRKPEIHDIHVVYGTAIVVGAMMTALLMPAFSVYQSWRGKSILGLFARLATGWFTVLLALTALTFLTGTSDYYSRIWFALWATLGITFLFAARGVLFAVLKSLRKRGMNVRRVLIVGAGVLGTNLVSRLREAEWTGYEVVGFLDDDPEKRAHTDILPPVLGNIDEIEDWVTEQGIDEVWIALPLRAENRVHDVLHHLRHSMVNIRFVPDIFSFRLLNHSVSEVVGIPMLDLSASPMTGVNRIIKAVEDRSLAMLFIILLSPVMLALAIMVKMTSHGPILYRQERIGWNGKPFMMLKFRSMPVDTEKHGVRWGGATHKATTKFGSFMRRTSLDELPQLFNVLKGDMSIVGPRPERTIFVEQFKDEIQDYMKKHLVKAGITGWAQVNGWRGDTDLEKRIQYDLYYIEHWSLGFDLKIIALTLLKGFMHKNAY